MIKLSMAILVFLAAGGQPLRAQAPALERTSPVASPPLAAEVRFQPLDVVIQPAPVLWSIPDAERSGMPAWLKWGLIGGLGVGALGALLASASIETPPPSVAEGAAKGFVVGFVVIGGGVAVYQAICKPGGWSEEHGLCSGRSSR